MRTQGRKEKKKKITSQEVEKKKPHLLSSCQTPSHSHTRGGGVPHPPVTAEVIQKKETQPRSHTQDPPIRKADPKKKKRPPPARGRGEARVGGGGGKSRITSKSSHPAQRQSIDGRRARICARLSPLNRAWSGILARRHNRNRKADWKEGGRDSKIDSEIDRQQQRQAKQHRNDDGIPTS